MYKYAVYKPRGGDARIKAGRELLYSISGDETLDAAVDTYLVDITWVSKMFWRNDTDATQTYAYSYTTSQSNHFGQRSQHGFSVGGSFEGMGMTVDHGNHKRTTPLTPHLLPEEVQPQKGVDVLHSRCLGAVVERG